MSKREIVAGVIDQTIDIWVGDSSSTVGAGLTGLTFESASLVCYYRKGATGAAAELSLATQTVGGAHDDGGFVEIDATNMPGVYRLDLSDTMVAAEGVLIVQLTGAADMAPVNVEIEVVSADLRALADRNADLIESNRGFHTWQGNYFYVDPVNGDTHANGATGGRSDPYLTIQDCHDEAVTDSNHDVIFLVAGAPAGVTTHTIAGTTTINKRYTFLRGPGRDFIITRSGNGNTLAITGDGVEISGVQIGTAGTGSGDGVNIFEADFARVHNCWFLATQGDGVHILRGNNCQVHNNNFEGTGVDDSGQGIHIVGTSGSSNDNRIYNNHFSGTGGDAILIEDGTTNDTTITDNEIHDAGGWAINITASSTDALVHGNFMGNNASGDINDGGTTSVIKNNEDVPSVAEFNARTLIAADYASPARVVRYVDANASDDTGDGLTWATAKKTIGATIAAISPADAGDKIDIGPGTYSEAVDASGNVNLLISGAGQSTTISATDDAALRVGSGTVVRDLRAVSTGTTSIALAAESTEDVVAERCFLSAQTDAYIGSCDRLTFRDCYIFCTNDTLNLSGCDNVLAENCVIETSSATATSAASHAIWVLTSGRTSFRFVGCKIEAKRTANTNEHTIAVAVEGTSQSHIDLIDCTITAYNTDTSSGSGDVIGIGGATGDGTAGDVHVRNSHITAHTGGAGDAYALSQGSFTLAVDAATLYSPSATAGTITRLAPSVTEFEARTIVAADYFDPANDVVAQVTLVITTTNNSDMRGTDNAALASVCTDTRLAELDAGNLPTDIAAIAADLPGTVTKNVALANFPFYMVLSADHVAAATGKSVVATRSIDGAAFAPCANAVAEISTGVYDIDLEATDLNGDTITLRFTAADCDARIITIVTKPT